MKVYFIKTRYLILYWSFFLIGVIASLLMISLPLFFKFFLQKDFKFVLVAIGIFLLIQSLRFYEKIIRRRIFRIESKDGVMRMVANEKMEDLSVETINEIKILENCLVIVLSNNNVLTVFDDFSDYGELLDKFKALKDLIAKKSSNTHI